MARKGPANVKGVKGGTKGFIQTPAKLVTKKGMRKG